MNLRVELCSRADLERLLAQSSAHDAAHHRERFELQEAGGAMYLVAWRGEQNVGRATVYFESKYEAVRARHPGTAEINALEASPQRQGTGTALIAAAERLSAALGHPSIGLAVEPSNPAARALYDRLGYVTLGIGQAIDEWVELRNDRADVVHNDPCDYLLKGLASTDSPVTI